MQKVKIRARDVKPYFYALKCYVGDHDKPIDNQIVGIKWCGYGDNLLWFMLETYNFFSAAPDDELELVEIDPGPDYRSKPPFELPPRPELPETIFERSRLAKQSRDMDLMKRTIQELEEVLTKERDELRKTNKKLVEMGTLLTQILHGKTNVKTT